jgi:hypothetical protein
MLGSRRGRPSLIGRAAQTAARTAVIAGTATVVSNKVAARQTAAAPRPAPGPEVATVATATAPEAGAAMTEDRLALLKQLADLHSAGVLTAEEFAEQKARLLA